MNFSGLKFYTVDPKGRVSLPLPATREWSVWTAFRGEHCLIVVPAPIEQLTDIEARRAAFPVHPHPSSGRFQIPASERHFFGFEAYRDVICTGMGGWFEYWNPDVFAAHSGVTLEQGRAIAAKGEG